MAEFDAPAPHDAAAGILRECRARYAELKSYRDSGEVQHDWSDLIALLSPKQKKTLKSELYREPQVTRFRGWFRRPEDLRFEWNSQHPYPPLRHIENFSVIWNGPRGAFYHSSHGSAPCESLRSAVAGAAGVSTGSAFHFATRRDVEVDLALPDDVFTTSPDSHLPYGSASPGLERLGGT